MGNNSTQKNTGKSAAQAVLAEMSEIMKKQQRINEDIDARLEKSKRFEQMLEQDLGMSLKTLKYQLEFLSEESPEEEFVIKKTINELIEAHSEKPQRSVFIAPNAI